MPRRSKPPSYRLHKASGQAIVTLHGGIRYLGKFNTPKSLAKYADAIKEWSAQETAPAPPPTADDAKILELAQLFRQWAKSYYRSDGKSTREAPHFDYALKPLLLLYGQELAKDFGPLKLENVQKLMFAGFTDARGKQVRPWRHKYVNRQIGRLRQIFKWGVSQELVPASVLAAIKTTAPLKRGRGPWRESQKVLPVDDRHVTATLPFLPQVVADMVRVHRLTGCRPHEICDMRVGEIDRTSEVWVYRPAKHKTAHHGKARWVHIGPKAQEILLPYLVREVGSSDADGNELDRCEMRDDESYCFSPADSERKRHKDQHATRKTPLSCGNKPGSRSEQRPKRSPQRTPQDHYTSSSYARAIARACDRADEKAHKDDPSIGADTRVVPRWAPNQLRHALATEVCKLIGIEGSRTVLGHSNASTTEIYAEQDYELASRIMREIG